jgi:hypothetical protein
LDTIICVGQTSTFTHGGCSTLQQLMMPYVSPCIGKTTNRRAGCGKSARPVRREGRRIAPFLPLSGNPSEYWIPAPRFRGDKLRRNDGMFRP